MSKIVHFSEAASIALHSMIIIAKSKHLITIHEIADKTGASRNHIAKISQGLVKKNFLKSTRGPSGGFVLKKPPEKITLLEIYECVEGEIEIEGCPSDKPLCPFQLCLMGNIIQKVTTEIKAYLKSHTLKDYLK
jgi:Rrf2 family protein